MNEGARARSEQARRAFTFGRVFVALAAVALRYVPLRYSAARCGAVRRSAVRHYGAVRCGTVRRDDGEGYYEWKTRPWLGC